MQTRQFDQCLRSEDHSRRMSLGRNYPPEGKDSLRILHSSRQNLYDYLIDYYSYRFRLLVELHKKSSCVFKYQIHSSTLLELQLHTYKGMFYDKKRFETIYTVHEKWGRI